MENDNQNYHTDTDIIFVVPPISTQFFSDAPSLGIAYLAAILEPFYKVSVFECQTDRVFESIDIVLKIKSQKPKIIGLSLTTLNIPQAKKIIEHIHKMDDRPVLIAGGPHATVLPDETLAIGVDYVIIGEGEKTVLELMDFIFNRSSFKKIDEIQGVAFIRDNQVVMTNKRELTDVSSLPFPAWQYFKIERYNSVVRKNNRCLPVMAGRGCPGCCTFCFKGLFGTKLRLRSPENVVDEIQYLKENFHIDEFVILDENFTTVKKYVLDFCNLLIERKINLPWFLGSGVRVDRVDDEIVQIMKLAGCYRTSLGVESGNEQILKDIGKNTTKSQIINAVALFKKYEYELTLFFILGTPTETYESIIDSIEFAIELDPDIIQFSIATPFPGTAMFEQLDSEGLLLTKDWQDYNIYIPGNKPIFTHPNLSWNELLKLRRRAYKDFYFRIGFAMKQIRNIKSFSDFQLLLKKTLSFLKMFSTKGK